MPGGVRSNWRSKPTRSWTFCPRRRRGMPCATASHTPWSGAASPVPSDANALRIASHAPALGTGLAVAQGPRRPLFYFGVLATGFVLGGFVHSLLRRFLPQGPAKEIFTWSVTPTLGPVHMDLLVVSITLGPIGLDVSLLALVGVAIAYYVARSIFRSEARYVRGPVVQPHPDPAARAGAGLRREADPGDRILVGAGDQRVQAQPQGRHERRPAHRAPPPRRPTADLEPPLLGRSEAPERLALAGGRRSEDLAAAVHDLGVRAQRGDELLQSRLLDGPERRFALLIPLLEPRGGVDAGAGQGLQHEPTRFPRNEAAALAPL